MSTEGEELDAICRENDGYWPAIRDDLIARGYRKQEPVSEPTEAEVEAAATVLYEKYDAIYDASHLSWLNFADEARAALVAARTVTNGDKQ